jgi:hypothetical protein
MEGKVMRKKRPLATILILEDLHYFQAIYREIFPIDIVILAAVSIEEATAFFRLHRGKIDAMIIDACVPGAKINTDIFVHDVRTAGFERPMIAASSLGCNSNILIEAGCNQAARKGLGAAKAVLEALLQE